MVTLLQFAMERENCYAFCISLSLVLTLLTFSLFQASPTKLSFFIANAKALLLSFCLLCRMVFTLQQSKRYKICICNNYKFLQQHIRSSTQFRVKEKVDRKKKTLIRNSVIEKSELLLFCSNCYFFFEKKIVPIQGRTHMLYIEKSVCIGKCLCP